MARSTWLILLLAGYLLSGGWHWFEPAARKVQQGISEFSNGQYDRALEYFVSAKGDAPDSQILRFNTAATLLRMEKFQEALQELAEFKEDEAVPLPQHVHFNKGNAYFRVQDYKNALSEYKKSLLGDPHDLEAKKNYEITLKKIKEEEQKQQDQQDPQENQDEDQQDQPQPDQQQQKPHEDVLEYLNQNEREQQKKQRQKQAVLIGREKDW